MDFGKIDSADLSTLDFALPPDSEHNSRVLGAGNGKQKTPEIRVGCAKWGRKDWIGKIYPKGTKEKDFLEEYSRRFNCIELNATFYKLPSVRQVTEWKSRVGDDFRFCPKFTDKITHIKRLKEAEKYTQIFLEGIAAFGNNLGPAFLQTPPNYAVKNLETMEAFISALPDELDLFVELRHPGWYADPKVNEKVFAMFERHQTGAVITDVVGRRDCVHMRLTSRSAFIRFVGNSLHPTDYTRCDEWITRILNWIDQGLERVYFLMHQHEELLSPELCRYFIRELNKRANLGIPEPEFVEEIASGQKD